MRKNKIPVRFTGQHLTIDKVLIAYAIKIAKINEHDIVLDIGAGKGFLTIHLARRCKKVIAIEKDKSLLKPLRQKFLQKSNVKIIATDFRDYKFPAEAFKVLSNIPFGITSDILKSLMFSNVEYFIGGALVVQLETAQKLFSEKIFNPYIVFYHSFFDLELKSEIAPESFIPPPTVKSALLKIEKKKKIKIDVNAKEKYLHFLFFMLKFPDLSARTVLKKVFRKRQVRELSKKYGINPEGQVILLSANQWSGCFIELLEKVPEKYHPKEQFHSSKTALSR